MLGEMVFDIKGNPLGVMVQESEEGYILVLTELSFYSEYNKEQLKDFSRKERKWIKRILKGK